MTEYDRLEAIHQRARRRAARVHRRADGDVDWDAVRAATRDTDRACADQFRRDTAAFVRAMRGAR